MLPERKQYLAWIQDAHQSGARLNPACAEVGISLRTYRRWYRAGQVSWDKRPDAVRAAPKNKLTEAEQAAIIAVCNLPRFASLPPTQIVPTLLDEGLYYGSESTFYRVLGQHEQLTHRGRSLAPRASKAPQTFTATSPCQVFCWDITYLPSPVRGQFYVTPDQRHTGEDSEILAQRKMMMERAKAQNPVRWGTQEVRNCEPVGPTTLNPVKGQQQPRLQAA